MKKYCGPDHFLGASVETDAMKIVSLDECTPFYIQDGNGGFTTTYIVLYVELLTYKVTLIPFPQVGTIHFVRALEILQSMRGQMSTIILDDESSYTPLDQSLNPSQHSKNGKSVIQEVLDQADTQNSEFSKHILFKIAASTAFLLLNKQILTD